jgi:hypothetical protein
MSPVPIQAPLSNIQSPVVPPSILKQSINYQQKPPIHEAKGHNNVNDDDDDEEEEVKDIRMGNIGST